MSDYAFRRMAESDLPMLRQWLETPEVRTWWGDPDEQYALVSGDLHEPSIRLWIVSHDGLPFGYIQDYDPQAWPGHHFLDKPPGTRGIDQFIGVPAMIGRGHGNAFIRMHVQRLFTDGAPRVVTDPDPENARAIRAYRKAGFTAYGRNVENTEWGPALLMETRPA